MGLVLGAFWLAYALFEIPGGWMGGTSPTSDSRTSSNVTMPSVFCGASDFEKQFADVQAHWRELQRQLQELSKPSPQPAELYRPR